MRRKWRRRRARAGLLGRAAGRAGRGGGHEVKVYLGAHLARSEGRAAPCGVTDIPPPHAAIHLPFKTLSLRFPSFLSFLSRLHCLSPKFSPLLPLRLLAPVALACTGGPPLQSLPCAATHLPPPIVCFCAKITCGSASACRSLFAQLAFALCHEGLSSTGFRGVFGIILSWRISSITCFCLSPCLFLCVVSSSGGRHSLISLCCLPQAHALPTLAPDAVPSRRTSSSDAFPTRLSLPQSRICP